MKKLYNLISVMIIFGVVLFANISLAKTDEELALLMENETFKLHMQNGYVKVHKRNELNTKDLEKEDNSAQLTDDKFEKAGRKKPKTAKTE